MSPRDPSSRNSPQNHPCTNSDIFPSSLSLLRFKPSRGSPADHTQKSEDPQSDAAPSIFKKRIRLPRRPVGFYSSLAKSSLLPVSVQPARSGAQTENSILVTHRCPRAKSHCNTATSAPSAPSTAAGQQQRWVVTQTPHEPQGPEDAPPSPLQEACGAPG